MKQRHASELGTLVEPEATAYMAACDLQGFQPAQLLQLLRTMLLIRRVEEKIAQWVEQGVVRCPCHLGIGQEAIAAGIARSLRPDDRLFGNHRSHGHYLAAGGDPGALLAEVLGRASGCSGGMGGSMHLRARAHGFYGSVPIVGATIPIAVGAALAAKMDGGDSVAVAFFGDGASEEGVMHESLNLASSYQLPVVFVCENNQYSSHLDIALRQPSDRVSRYADAHCVRATVIDGNDVTTVARVAAELIAAARHSTPVFLETVTYRWRGHVGPKEDVDVGVRRSMDSLAAWKRRDPVRRLEDALAQGAVSTREELRLLADEVRAQVEELAARALEAPWPPPQSLPGFVYASN
jgi:acetoin:2,6-dichlorophenolindophenol oxidoreductase subunit alpha